MSTVIKAGHARKLTSRLSTVELADHWREATSVIASAREQAAGILAEAEEQARRMVETAGELARVQGYEKGFAEGQTAGHAEALARGKQEFSEKLASLAAMFQSAIAAFEETKEQLRLNAERDLLDFAVLTASKLTFAIGELHREAVGENFRALVSLVTDKTDVTVRCNPKDVDTLRVFAESMLDSARGGQRVKLVEDESVSAGGCILLSGNAVVDASLETQVAEMVSILVGKNSNA